MGKVELKIEVDEALLRRAEAKGVSLEAVVDEALRSAAGDPVLTLVESARLKARDLIGAEERARKWRESSAETIAAHNRFVEEHGEFGKAWRNW